MSEEKQPKQYESAEEVYEDMKKEAQKQLGEYKFTEGMIEALDTAKEMLVAERKADFIDEMTEFLTEEGLEVPTSLSPKKEEFTKRAAELEPTLPDKIEKAFEDITHKKMLKFIGYFMEDTNNRKNMPEFKKLIELLTNEQKEKVYHALREEKIEDWHEKDMVITFEEMIGYSFDFARKNILTEIDPEHEPILAYLSKYTKGYTKAVRDRLEWANEMKMIRLTRLPQLVKVVENFMQTFYIHKIEDEEVKTQAAIDLAGLLLDYFPNAETDLLDEFKNMIEQNKAAKLAAANIQSEAEQAI